MIMKTEKLSLELRFTTRKIVNLTEELKGKNLSEIYFKSLNNSDIKTLAKIIYTFGEVEGKNPFNGDINKTYDFIDEYMKENKKTYQDIFDELAEVINNEGFFIKKMTKEELEIMKNNPLSSIDLEKTMNEVVNKVATSVVEEEFKGFKG